MYKIAVLGDRDSVLGFRALGLEVFAVGEAAEARQTLHRLAKDQYAVIYITEQLAAQLTDDIDHYKDELMPAIILIPGKGGSLDLGVSALQSATERAIGMDII